MTIRCSSCGAGLDLDGAFPNAVVRCRFCNETTVVTLPAGRQSATPPTTPYRTPAVVERAPASSPGSVTRADAVTGTADGGPCPRCKNPLAHATTSGVDVHDCSGESGSGCGGVFTSHEALAALIAMSVHDETLARAGGSSPAEQHGLDDRAVYLRCPGCDAPMNRSRFAADLPVVVDVCKHHGIWFDRGEMTSALAFAARGGHYDPTRHRGRRPGDPKPKETPSRAPPLIADGMHLAALDWDDLDMATGAELLVDVLLAIATWRH